MTTSCPSESAGGPARAKGAQILAAARRVFLEHGFDAATTDMIQREAGVSKSTVYAHFPTKVELFQAVIRAECACFMEGLLADQVGRDDTRECLAEIGFRFLDLLLSPGALAFHRIIVAEAARFPALGRTFYSSGPERLNARIAAVLRAAAARGEIAVPDPERAAEHYLGVLKGDLHLRCLVGVEQKPSAQALRAAVEQATDRFLRAYRAGSGPRSGPC